MQKFQQRLVCLAQTSLLCCWLSVQVASADSIQASASTTTATVAPAAKDEALIQQLVSAGIQPLYRELEQRSQQLTQSSTEFCKDSSLANFQQLREAWGEAMLAWQRTDSLLFGPATAEQMDFQINFTPPKKQIIKGLLDSDKALTVEALTAAGVGAQGLSSLEYLLFDREQTVEQLLASFKESKGQIRCSYVQTASTLLEQNIKKVTTPWLSGKAVALFSSNQEVIDVLIGKSYQTLEKINVKKLALPLGITDEKQLSHPYDLEAWRSSYSFKIIVANVDGLRRVFIDGGFLAWIDKTFPNEATKTAIVSFERQLNDLVKMQLPAGDPFTIAEQKIISPERTELIERCRGLQMGVKRQLAIITQAQLGFNDNDGD